MKKTITQTCYFLFGLGAAIFIHTNLWAQNFTADKVPENALPEVSPVNGGSMAKIINPQNEVQNIFDIQFNYTPGIGNGVSCVYTGTEFWMGLYSNDSIYTLDPSGNITSGFTIPGVGISTSGVRAFAFDGTYIYAACLGNAIFRIDPSTKTLIDSIPISFVARGLAYDSTANGGQGGFWTCNGNNPLRLVSMTGTILETITQAEHHVPSIYGIAFDPYTSGGPYLWLFSQGITGDSSKLHRIYIPGHSHTGVVHNVNADIADTGFIAGSVSVTWRYDSAHYTLMGCDQGPLDRLFGYELADYFPPAVDASLSKIDFYPPFTKIPSFQITPLNWDVTIENYGTNTLNDVTTTLVVDDGAVPVFTPPDFHNLGISPGSNGVANFASYLPPQIPHEYNVTCITNTGTQVDEDATNDEQSYSFEITDTVMARDNNIPVSTLGLPRDNPGVLGQLFELPFGADVTSATFSLRTPDIGDTVSVDLYTYSSEPDAIIASSDIYVITGADTDGVTLTLPFTNGPLFVNPGLYFLGVNQFATDSNISLRTSPFNYRPASAYFHFEGGSWIAVEDNNGGLDPFFICYILRLNMHNFTISTGEITDRNFMVFPNPTTNQLNINLKSLANDFKAELFDLVGNKILEKNNTMAEEMLLDVSNITPGIYVLRMTADGTFTSVRIAIN